MHGSVIAFDLDGTLVDTAPDLIGALNVVLAQQGLPFVPLEAARTLVGHGGRVMLERGFELAGEPLSEARAADLTGRFVDIYLARIADESTPFPGVEAALDQLVQAGAKLAVCTNKRTSLSVALLDALGLSARFDVIFGADLAGVQKPDPKPLLMCIERAGGRPERALFVGDSMIDVATARAARVPIVGVSFGFSEQPLRAQDLDALIDSFAELPAVARRLLAGLAG
jgi:phosphoglycolate phosphatase